MSVFRTFLQIILWLHLACTLESRLFRRDTRSENVTIAKPNLKMPKEGEAKGKQENTVGAPDRFAGVLASLRSRSLAFKGGNSIRQSNLSLPLESQTEGAPEKKIHVRTSDPISPGKFVGRPDADQFKSTANVQGNASWDFPLPMNQKIALIVRGGAFKQTCTGCPHCSTDVPDLQIQTAEALVKNVIHPMKEQGDEVDMFVFLLPCHFNSVLIDAYRHFWGPEHSIKASIDIVSTSNQGQSFRKVLDLFKASADVSKYDLTLIIRPDLRFASKFTGIKANWNAINFLNYCELHSGFGKICVHDALQAVPKKMFAAWDKLVGDEHCFPLQKPTRASTNGHKCMKEAIARHIQCGVLTSWRPQHNLRSYGAAGPNPVANLY